MPTSRLFIIISIALILFTIIGGVLLWWPRYQNYLGVKAEWAMKDAALRQKIDYFNNLRSIKNKIEEQKDQIAKIDAALPLDLQIDLPNFASFLSRAAAENGVLIEKVEWSSGKALAATAGSEIGKAGFNFKAKGSYSSIKNFISKIYRSARIAEVDSLSFSSEKGKGETTQDSVFDFSMDVSASYYSKPTSFVPAK